MDIQAKILKNQRIKESILLTREKRKNQECKVFEIKIQKNKLKENQLNALKMCFVEAKWIANSFISFIENKENKIKDFKLENNVLVKTKDKSFESRELKYLGSQMRQSIIAELISNIKGLSVLKKNGHKVGSLKYKSKYYSLNLQQYKTTYRFYSNNKIKIQNIPGKLVVNGLDQFINDEDLEFANAKLVNKPDGYYVLITTYKNKKLIRNKKQTIKEDIGIDLGIKNNITLSNGLTYSFSIEESDRLKRLQAKLAKKQKGSKNRYKIINKIQKQYQKSLNKKQDFSNKVVHNILKYEKIYIQNDNITSWKENGFGKQIQGSILGRIKSKLKTRSNENQIIWIEQFEKTSKTCSNCYFINENLTLSDRDFECKYCNLLIDRDVNAAKNMIVFGKKLLKIPTEHRDLKPAEKNFQTFVETGSSQFKNCE